MSDIVFDNKIVLIDGRKIINQDMFEMKSNIEKENGLYKIKGYFTYKNKKLINKNYDMLTSLGFSIDQDQILINSSLFFTEVSNYKSNKLFLHSNILELDLLKNKYEEIQYNIECNIECGENSNLELKQIELLDEISKDIEKSICKKLDHIIVLN